MNDKRIISTISAIYFIITSFLIFIFLTLSIVFIVLQNGLYIENISIPKLKINQLYIKWNESLDISIEEIKIDKNKESSDTALDLKRISKEFSKFENYYNIFEKVNIQKISYNNIQASFKYVRGGDGYFNAKSNDLVINGSIFFEEEFINIKVNRFKDYIRDITIDGNIILDIDKHTASTKLNINIHDEMQLKLFSFVNEANIFYKIDSDKEIKNISYVIGLFELDSALDYWTDKAITFSSVSIKSLHGRASIKDLSDAYKNIYVHAVGNNLKYKYNPNLDAIHTKSTDVIFKNGKLYIYPRQAHTYKSKLKDSWIKIDFTTKEELLTVQLLFDGQLDEDTLTILNQYKIKVPFLQNSGATNVDLAINVNLRTIAVSARGKFFTDKANFTYKNNQIDVSNAHISLNNYDISIDNMIAKYKEIVTSEVNVKYNANTSRGLINLDITAIDFNKLNLHLTMPKLKARYILEPNNDHIEINPSLWSFKNHLISAQKIKIPFDIHAQTLSIPKVQLTSPNIGIADVRGTVNLETMVYDFNASLVKSNIDNISLLESKRPTIYIKYDENLFISTKERLHFKVRDIDSFINETTVSLKNDILEMDETYINIGEVVKAKLSSTYSLKNNKGEVRTNRLRIKTKALGTLYMESYDTNFDISKKENDLHISSTDLEMSFVYNEEGWKLALNSALRLARNSALLQKYDLTKGTVSIIKNVSDSNIKIDATLYSANKVMVVDNVPLDKYTITGEVDTKTDIISFVVNDHVKVLIDNDVFVHTKDIGINMNAIADIVNAKNGDLKNYSSANVLLKADNTYLFISPTRHVLSEKINLSYSHKLLKATLKHKEGIANLKFKNGFFHIEGDKFNDVFMENLFALSKFKNGTFKFTISGTPNQYDGLFTMNNTILLEYKLLNNILAFINTVPALVTFSTPSYSRSGLHVKNAYMKFKSKDDVFHISDIFLDSAELNILGQGTASILHNTIDLDLNLKTDLGSTVSKVPLVGYILMHDDSVSTGLKITGALNNPDIKSKIAKDIAIAPLNILLRTITLPFYLLESIDKNTTKEK
ncbi:MAG: AsmA-like C-terminal domain-containing protein [Sulfurimonas sp.]|nr:AsmA-like C-terminal domain-containing protein [Sulfurimonas sp.]